MSTTNELCSNTDDFILQLKLTLRTDSPHDASHVIDAIKNALLEGESLTEYTFDGDW